MFGSGKSNILKAQLYKDNYVITYEDSIKSSLVVYKSKPQDILKS